MERSDPEAEGPIAVWRWLRWYPLVVAALFAILWLAWPQREGAVESDVDPAEVAAVTVVDPLPLSVGEDVERGPSLLARGRDRAVALEEAAERVAGAFGLRLSEGVHGLREKVGREELKSGGLKAARLTPFVGPYLRYQHARDLFATGDAELQDEARRQTVVALAELTLDASAAGIGHAAAGAEGALQALDGAVQVVDFADFAVSLHAELGSPLGFAGLDRLDTTIDALASKALGEIDGLAPFVDRMLTLEKPAWLESVSPELAGQARDLLRDLLSRDEER